MPLLSIAENIFLGHEPAYAGVIDWFEAFRRTQALLAKVGLKEHPNTLIGSLGTGKQQLVEIAKALNKKVKLLILDEPTASLNETDSDALLALLRELRAQGIASILVEGGARVAQSFLAEDLIDRIALFSSPLEIGEEGVSSPVTVRSLPIGFAPHRSALYDTDNFTEFTRQ